MSTLSRASQAHSNRKSKAEDHRQVSRSILRTRSFSLILLALASAVSAPLASAAAGTLNLPATPITANQSFVAPSSFLATTLSGVGAGFDITNATYLGWCGDDQFAPVAVTQLVTAYSTYSATLPANAANAAWPKVNHVLNNKIGTPDEIQAAIWILLNGFTTFDVTPSVTAMVNAANANPGFVPAAGQTVAVLLYIDGFAPAGPVQDTIIEVKVPAGACVVIIDEDGVDNDMKNIELAAQARGVTPDYLVNDDRPTEIGNPWLRWNERFPGDIVKLPTGQRTDEGWFALPSRIRYADDRTTNLTYDQWIKAFVDGTLPQDKLDKVRDVMPLRNQELAKLVGRTCVAIVYDSDLSINYQPLNANLQGGRYGKFAFTVLALEVPGSIQESKSSTSLYDLWLRIEPPMQAGAPLQVPLHEYPDTVQTTRAKYANGVLTVRATSSFGSTPKMTISIDGPDAGADRNVSPFIVEAPMTFKNGAYEYTVTTATNLVGRRVVVQTNTGGVYDDYIIK